MSATPLTSTCPICSGPNRCGEVNPEHRIDGRCWCAGETFPPEIFALVPEHRLNQSCICKSCLDMFKRGELSRKPLTRN